MIKTINLINNSKPKIFTINLINNSKPKIFIMTKSKMNSF